jgi:hypothetical protein
MELTLIIKKSGMKNANCSKTVKSLRNKDINLHDIIFIDKFSDIVYGMIKSDWWIILYDDEFMENRLVEALVIAGDCERFDAYSCYKAFYSEDKDPVITICPRMFRRGIQIEQDVLYPIMPVKMETILDGWVMNHDYMQN